MRFAARNPPKGRAGTLASLPAGPFPPTPGPDATRRKAWRNGAGTPIAHPACAPEFANHSPRPRGSRVARWSAAFFGLWIAATVADDPPGVRIVNFAIPESLTGRAGDPERGRRIVRDPDRATCLICHAMPIEEEPDPGNIGPPLNGVASRYTAGELRLRLVDPKRLNPETVMPSYFAREGFHRVAPDYRGRSIYSASEIEDVIAYLLTLTGE